MLRKLNRITVFLLILTTAFLTFIFWCKSSQSNGLQLDDNPAHGSYGSVRQDASRSLVLSGDQCAVAFPGFNKEIENAVAKGPVRLKRMKDTTPGLAQGRIKNGKLYIISGAQENSLHRMPAILHALHRAIITSPSPLPDTIFALTISDTPVPNTWSFARSDDDLTPDTPWLMPHYSSWSWPMESLGPLDEALIRIGQVEKSTQWDKKIDKAVWRGTLWFGPDWRPGLRLMLGEVSKQQEWADVAGWGQGQNNTLSIEEFCKYKYIIYAEGKTYSGRLPYHQACASIILTPPLTFLLHSTHLLRPTFSSLLPLEPQSHAHPQVPTPPPIESYPRHETATTWPISYPPESANVIFVQQDWADIDLVIDYLRNNPKIAEGIARRQRELMVGEGHLSEGAEACYWRSLIRVWSGVVKVDESEWEEGMRWETFSLLGQMGYDGIQA